MITKKLSNLDRTTIAASVVIRLNENLAKEKEAAIKQYIESDAFKKLKEEKNSLLELKIRELNSVAKEISNSIVHYNQTKEATNSTLGHDIIPSGYLYWRKTAQAPSPFEPGEITELKVKLHNKLIEDHLKSLRVKEPLSEERSKTLRIKGESLILRSENQDPVYLDTYLMDVLKNEL